MGDKSTTLTYIYIASGVGAAAVIIIIFVSVLLVRCHRRGKKTNNGDSGQTKGLAGANAYTTVSPATAQDFDSMNSNDPNDQKVVYSSLGRGGGRTGERPILENSMYVEVRTEGVHYPPLLKSNTAGLYDIVSDMYD